LLKTTRCNRLFFQFPISFVYFRVKKHFLNWDTFHICKPEHWSVGLYKHCHFFSRQKRFRIFERFWQKQDSLFLSHGSLRNALQIGCI